MTNELEAGVEAVLERRVEARHCTRRGEYDIFSTPNLVMLIEEAAIEALAPHLGPDQDSVGSTVTIAHQAPTLIGQTVRAAARVSEVDRRRVAFEITVTDELDTIGTGTHERFIVDVPGFEARLADKSSKLG